MDWRDLLAAFVIVLVSYWVAFCSNVPKYFVKSKKKKIRGNISGESKRENTGSFFKKFDLLVLFRSESEESKKIAEDFVGSCDLSCELCEADGYDFTVLEHLNIPVLFIIDQGPQIFDFLNEKEKDPKYVRAYRRRYLNNLRYAVRSAGDKAFAQFIDETLKDLGAKRLTDLDSKDFDWSLLKQSDETVN